MELGERPKGRDATDEETSGTSDSGASSLGLSVESLTAEIASQLGYQKERGVVVDAVEPGSPAEESGISQGDLIKEVNRKPVTTAKEFQGLIGKLRSGDTAALLVRRGETTAYMGVQVP